MHLFKAIKFNLSHWCITYDDYCREMRENAERLIYERGYMEKSDLKWFYNYPPKGKKQEVRTSGSTGTPVKFYCNPERIASSLSLVDYRFAQLGKTDETRFMRLWYPTTGHSWWQLLKEKLFRKQTNEIFFSYFDFLEDKGIEDFCEEVNYSQPEFIEGYAGGIIAAASWLKANNLKCKVNTIVTGAGMVTEDQHKLIEESFQCKHYDRYGCSEFGEIAHQLGNGYYELNPHLSIELSENLTEFYGLDEVPDGFYEIFITDDRNDMTNFWRYRMNDIVHVVNNKIIAIEGRTEQVYNINGKDLPTGAFYQTMKDFEVDQWQVIVDKENLTVKTTPDILSDKDQKLFQKYFKGFNIKFEKGNYETVGRRKKIQEVIIKNI